MQAASGDSISRFSTLPPESGVSGVPAEAFLTAEPAAGRLTDREDRKFYEVAMTGTADFLVTRNTKHFPGDPVVVPPSGFLERDAAHGSTSATAGM